MMNTFRTTVTTAALSVILAVPLSMPAGAVCYLGECTTAMPADTTPSMNGSRVSFSPSPAQQKPVKVAEHNSWSAFAYNDQMFIMDEFNDGSKFAIVEAGEKVGVQMANLSWHLVPGQSYKMKITIDGRVFSGTVPVMDKTTLGYEDVPSDFIAAFCNGHTAHIEIEQLFSGDIQSLPDAKATVEDAFLYEKTVM